MAETYVKARSEWVYLSTGRLIVQETPSTFISAPGVMLPAEAFWRKTAAITIAGIGLLLRIRKRHFNLSRLRLRDRRAPAIWDTVLAAQCSNNIRMPTATTSGSSC